MGTPFKMKGSPYKLPRTKVVESGDDMGVWKKIHKDPLVQELSRHPENMGLTTRELKKRAKMMRG